MAIQSKYSNTQVETLINELLSVLETHQAATDLSLMALGNCASHLINTQINDSSRTAIAEQFAKALQSSVKMMK